MPTGRIFPLAAPSRRFPRPSPYRTCPRPYTFPTKSGVKTVLVEIHLDSGPVYISQGGVSATGRFYEPRLTSISTISREIPYITGMYRAGDVTLNLASPNREWETIAANEPILHRRVYISYANASEPLERAARIFTGTIADYEFAGGMLQLTCRDLTFDRFDQPLCANIPLINETNFANMPPSAHYKGFLCPTTYGGWQANFTNASTGNLPLPAYLVDPAIGQANYRYLLAVYRKTGNFDLSSLTYSAIGLVVTSSNSTVRRYGTTWVGAAPTVTEVLLSGDIYAVYADFSSDQRGDPDDGKEITWRAQTLLTNSPPRQLVNWLVSWVPELKSTDFDISSNSIGVDRAVGNSSYQEAFDSANDEGAVSLVWIGGTPIFLFADIIRKFTESYRMGLYTTRGGSYGLYFWGHLGTSDSSLSVSTLDAPITVDESIDIIAGSYKCTNLKEVATEVITFARRNPVDDKFTESLVVSDSTALTQLGRKRQKTLESSFLWDSVQNASDATLDLMSPLNRIHEFRLPIEWLYDLELTRLIKIKHRHMPGSYMREVMRDAPSAYWRFGEKIGTTAYDISGNALNGTYTGGYTLDRIGALTGDANSAVLLDGSTGYITVADNPLLDPGDTFTLAAWIYLTDDAGDRTIVSKGTNGYQLYTNARSLYLAKIGVGNIASSNVTIAASTWTHVVATKNGATTKLYINGVDVTNAGVDQTITATAIALNIGRETSSAAAFLSGSLDEVAIWPTALSAARVRILYLAGKARYSPESVSRIVSLEADFNPSNLSILVRTLEIKLAL